MCITAVLIGRGGRGLVRCVMCVRGLEEYSVNGVTTKNQPPEKEQIQHQVNFSASIFGLAADIFILKYNRNENYMDIKPQKMCSV